MKKTPIEIEHAVINFYVNEGLALTKVSEKVMNVYNYKVNSVTCKNILDRNGIQLRTRGGIKPLNVDELKNLYYNEHYTLQMIADKYNVTLNTIKHYLKLDGTYNPIHTFSDFDLRHDYFSSINTEAKAYLLGFLLADGNVYYPESGSAKLRLSVNKKDIYILELLKKELNTSNVIQEYYRDGMLSGEIGLAVTSNQLVQDVGKYGVIPRKTYCMQLPNLNEPFRKHMLRGLFDGDGSVGISKGAANAIVDIAGVREELLQVQNMLYDACGASKNKIYEDSTYIRKDGTRSISAHTMWWSADDLRAILNYLYVDANYALPRKYANAMQVLKALM